MYELLVLALLMEWPLHAYLIADIANNIIGPWEKISRGSLSTLLTKLEQAGLIEPADPARVPFPSNRPSRVFAITPAGRERFYQLMMDTTSNQGNYQRVFHIKALHLEFVSLEDRLFLLDHYITYCQVAARYQTSHAHDLATDPLKQKHTSPFLLHVAQDLMAVVAQEWQLEMAWAQRLREWVTSQNHPDGRMTIKPLERQREERNGEKS